MKATTRWGGGPDFAQVAEALKVPTNHIMSMVDPHDGSYVVHFTWDAEAYPPVIFEAQLRPDADGILIVCGDPVERPGMWEEVVARVEAGMEGRP